MTRLNGRFTAMLAFAAVIAAGPAAAGDDNTLRIIQEGDGNSLSVDQSKAYGSVIVGPDDAFAEKLGRATAAGDTGLVEGLERQGASAGPAEQLGENNEATIVMSGSGGELQLLQDNSDSVGNVGNTATVKALGDDTLGSVVQIGDANVATMKLETGARGLVSQFGDNNTGSLKVESGGSGELVQNGDGNNDPNVSVAAGTSASITFNGDGGQLPPGVAGMEVFSTNPGTITINQTSF